MWGLDIGTTNTSLGRWDESADRPRLLHLQQSAVAESLSTDTTPPATALAPA